MIGCQVTAQSAFVSAEQKMVDTLLACDLIDLVLSADVTHITVVSGDTDFVPPILFAKGWKTASLQLIVPKAGWSSGQTSILEDSGITVTELEDLDGA